MREIKFRVFFYDGIDYSTGEIIGVQQAYDEDYIRFDKHGELKPTDDCSIIMQYTGLKDKNGKEIYDGDIVRGNHKDNFMIESINGGLQMYNIRYYGQKYNELIAAATCNPQTSSWLQYSEVLGNIYENPELLK